MNFSSFERAQVAGFAYREARHTGSMDCMRAVCFVLRNRVKAAWGDGSWLNIIAAHHLVAANFDAWTMGELAPLNMNTDTTAGYLASPLSGAAEERRSGPAGAEPNSPGVGMVSGFQSGDRLLQQIVAQVDDIYFGQEAFDDRVRQTACCELAPLPEAAKPNRKPAPCLYYSFVDRPPRPWFAENIICRSQEHAQVGQIGTMMLYR
jgi:hypothetical protein